MSCIASPPMVVDDGGSGFEKARKRVWPDAEVQRFTFHAFCQVKRYTTTRPNLPAGAELYGIAKELLGVGDADAAAAWLAKYLSWCDKWDSFLTEETVADGGATLTHERLVKVLALL